MASRRRTTRVKSGDLVTIELVEPEAYASGADDTRPSTAFPWLAPHIPDRTGLTPAAVCKNPPWIFSLPARFYPFRADKPGRYQLVAELNPAYHTPNMRPPLPPLRPVSVTIVVSKRLV
jgi:hypothetical protein